MMDAGRHPRIKLLSYSEVVGVQGFVGSFQVRVRRKPRYVIEELCTGCGVCTEACVLRNRVPSEFEVGLGQRSAAYIPFAQAVPLKATIDPTTCLYLIRGKCSMKCQKACERGAIDFTMQEAFEDLRVGAIILATGYDLFDIGKLPQYGYGVYDNVYTGLEFERMLSAAGPTGGKVVKKDGRQPESIAFLHCAGSRDEKGLPYCSRFCCMNTLKQAQLARHKTHARIYEFYIDLRCTGKAYEEFYKRTQEQGVHLIRGKGVEVLPDDDGKLLVLAEDTLMGRPIELPVDMVVLTTGAQPAAGAKQLGQLVNVSLSPDGFFAEAHPKLRPVETATAGIFLAGCCQTPKDIPDTVAQASAAATQALKLLIRGAVEIDPTVASVIEDRCSGCGECIMVCPYRAIEIQQAKAHINPALCLGCGTCAAACEAKAIMAAHFTDEELVAEVDAILHRSELVVERENSGTR